MDLSLSPSTSNDTQSADSVTHEPVVEVQTISPKAHLSLGSSQLSHQKAPETIPPRGDTATIPGGDTATIPGGDTATIPGGDTATIPRGDTATIPGGDTGTTYVTLKADLSKDSIVIDVEELQKALDAYGKKKGQKSLSYLEDLDKKELAAVKVQYKYENLCLKSKSSTQSSCCTLRSKKGSDVQLNEPTILPDCYKEIKNLLDIEKNPVYAKAQEEWSRKETLFTSRVERKKKKVANLKNEIYQLIGFFSVFQGVLLTAVSQSNLLHCNNLWSPIALSVVASVVTVAGVLQKLMQIRSLQKTIHSEGQALTKVVERLCSLRRAGVDEFKFAEFEYKKTIKQSTYRNTIYLLLVIGSLLSFAVIFPISHWKILCQPGANPYANPK